MKLKILREKTSRIHFREIFFIVTTPTVLVSLNTVFGRKKLEKKVQEFFENSFWDCSG